MEKEILKECPKHGLTKYVLRKDGRYRCAKCASESVSERRRKVKKILVEYKGGKCEICGYDKCIDALEFHHLDPTQKEFGISNGDTQCVEKLKEEADKCILVCSNCHREIHFNLKNNTLKTQKDIQTKNEKVFYEKNPSEYKYKYKKYEDLDINQIKVDIDNDLTQKDICTKYSISIQTLKRFLKRNNINSPFDNHYKKYSDVNSKEEFFKAFRNCGSIKTMSTFFNVSQTTIRKWCRKFNLPTNNNDLKLIIM